MNGYDQLNLELAADERREIEAAGGVAPWADGSPKTVTRHVDNGEASRAMCSCGFVGTKHTDWGVARRDTLAHKCAP